MQPQSFWARHEYLTTFVVVVMGLVVLLGAGFGFAALAKGFHRAQRLADERNQTQINDIMISQQAQLVKVHQQQAQIRIVDAEGLAKSQQIINGTLTPAYLQYEAIQAQEKEVQGQNHTIIYIPTGNNGVPLVQTINPQK